MLEALAGAPRRDPSGDAARGPRPIRVLHVITRMILGGAQENTLLSCTLIDRSRFESEILTGPQTGSEGDLLGEARARGVAVHVESMLVREINPVKDLAALVSLVRFLRRGGYHVVHTHAAKAGIVGRIAARLAGVPVIVHTAHGLSITFAQSRSVSWLLVWLERACTRLSDAVVVVGESIREESLALGIGRPEQYHLIRSGIEIEAFRDVNVDRRAARELLGLPPGGFVVGFVGRLSPQKAPLDLVSSFALLAARRPDAHLVMVGDGPLRSGVEAAVARAGLEGRVHLVGLRRDVPRLLRAFDVLALCSRYEGLPRVIPEAMAAGLPILATRVDGTAEIIASGENGYLVEPGDIEAFADRLLEIASDPEGARRMGKRGLDRLDEYSAERMVRQLGELYSRLAKEKRIAAG